MTDYSTFDRFQGAWLGGVFASSWASFSRDTSKIIDFSHNLPGWIALREDIAQLVLENRHRQEIVSEIAAILPADSPEKVILLLLPLLLSDSYDKNIYGEIITQHKFELINTTEVQKDILIWNYLITLALTNRFKFEESNISTAIERVLNGVKLETTTWARRLEPIARAENNSSTLQQLTEQLHQLENLEIDTQSNAGLAIALSLSCFASTPRNFMLSVKRASQIDSPLSSEIVALTGTISGAYNGMGGIPNHWLFSLGGSRSWQQICHTAQTLFETWLGAYNPLNNRSFICDPKLEAIAIPQTIQSRPNLQIISQKSDLS